MSGKLKKFINCKIVRNHKLCDDYLWVLDGVIVDPEVMFFDYRRAADNIFDMGGAIISPGFIDIQINGGFGIDFTHDLINNQEGLLKVATNIVAHGVTAFCPTLVTSQPEVYHKVLKYLGPKKGGKKEGATILGAHLEGPFINITKKGAHEPKYIAELTNGISTLQEMYGDLTNVRIITLAPEKINSLDVIKWLAKQNKIVSLGHSDADTETGEKAIKSGANLITHLFNAMLPFHHRNPGLIGLLGTKFDQPVYCGLIADGIHTHPSTLRIAHQANPEGIVLVTDAISAMGLENGIHYIGDKQISISGNQARIAGTNTLCGSIATMDKCVKYFFDATNCSLVEALEAATLHPAQALGIEKTKGSLDYGCDADFIVLNDQLEIKSTWIAGECVYDYSN